MKSHDLAKHLTILAKILKKGSNVEIEDLEFSQFTIPSSANASIKQNEIPQALNMLVGLNQVNKQQWINLIQELNFNLEIRPRDAKRDIVGKLLNYLTDHPDERKKLTASKNKAPAGTSSELTEALSILLK